MDTAKGRECAREQWHSSFFSYSYYLTTCARRIGERAQDIHQGRDSQFTANRPNMAHGRVHQWGEHEDDSRLLEDARHLTWRQFYSNPKRFQYIRAAAARSERPITMFCDAHSSAGRDERRRRRDIESRYPATSRATCVDQLGGSLSPQLDHRIAECLSAARHFGCGFSLHSQTHEERSDLG